MPRKCVLVVVVIGEGDTEEHYKGGGDDFVGRKFECECEKN